MTGQPTPHGLVSDWTTGEKWSLLLAMQLSGGRHLAYCTNIHRGENWAETFANLEHHALAVKARVCPERPFALGLRLSGRAANELSNSATLLAFRRWLDAHACYVFTVNGFPYGQFHNTRVKEQVYRPDWADEARVAYTNCLFNLLAELVPPGGEGSVSTVPVSFKEFGVGPDAERVMRRNLWRCVEHIETLSERTGRQLHLGLEPEPLCHLETSTETVAFFQRMRDDRPNDGRLDQHLGVNYDACHLAVEFEEPAAALERLRNAGLLLSKVHLSSALALTPTPAARTRLAAFADDTYLHQVVARHHDGRLTRFRDLTPALAASETTEATEWRVHFHVPLHWEPDGVLGTTRPHLDGLLDAVAGDPELCRHFEMETYTWEVMPEPLRSRDVVEQLEHEYRWTLARWAERGVTPV